jgi:hypothetical protein
MVLLCGVFKYDNIKYMLPKFDILAFIKLNFKMKFKSFGLFDRILSFKFYKIIP